MKKFKDLIIFRGGGDVATGSIQKLYRIGYPILVLETSWPTTVRKTVALSEAVFTKKCTVEDMTAVLCNNIEEIEEAFANHYIPLLIDPEGEWIDKLNPIAVIDGIIAKKNLGTSKKMAPITIALGPGFIAGKDVDVVIETNRGHNLGRLIFDGEAEPNTHEPGNIEGYTIERLLRAPINGVFHTNMKIGDRINKGDTVAYVDDSRVCSNINGIIRGLIQNGTPVKKYMKLGDVDPRIQVNYRTISDKARNIGGGTLEAFLIMKNKKKLGQ